VVQPYASVTRLTFLIRDCDLEVCAWRSDLRSLLSVIDSIIFGLLPFSAVTEQSSERPDDLSGWENRHDQQQATLAPKLGSLSSPPVLQISRVPSTESYIRMACRKQLSSSLGYKLLVISIRQVRKR
jgi:hypothetical protein